MQGFNMGRYVPPEHEGIHTGNQLHKKKPPGLHGTTQTVRFEMPFGIFCLHCDGHIAQGVRFNAEKKKIGKYFSTPIFSFRMRHASCSGWIEIQTDPKNTAYVVTEGAKKRASADEDVGVGGGDAGVLRVRGPEEAALAEDPFAKVEKGVVDKTQAKRGAERIAELRGLSDRLWQDPWEHSRKMRRVFRTQRKELQAKHAATEAIRDRAGLHIELLDEIPDDARRAGLVEFGPDYGQMIESARTKPLFPLTATITTATTFDPAKGATAGRNSVGKTKAQLAVEAAREKLQSELRQNTRARVDPFLVHDRPRPALGLKLLKRKQAETEVDSPPGGESDAGRDLGVPPLEKALNDVGVVQPGVSLGLGAYDSDDD